MFRLRVSLHDPLLIDVIPLLRMPQHQRGIFTYCVPAELVPRLARGAFVLVPFRRANTWGICAQMPSSASAPIANFRPVTRVHEDAALTDDEMDTLLTTAAHYRMSCATVARTLFPLPPIRTVRGNDASYNTAPAFPEASTPPHTSWHPSGSTVVIPDTHEQRLQIMRDFALHMVRAQKTVLVCTPYRVWLAPIRAALAPLPCVTLDAAAGVRSYWSTYVHARTHPTVVITTRSGACFAPANLGGIILDLAHEDDHKSWDMQPKYDARVVTERIAHARAIPRLVISSTPRCEEWIAASKRVHVGSLAAPYTMVRLDHHWRAGGKGLLTDALLVAIRRTLAADRAILVLHNRRGRFGRVSCSDCGRVEQCPVCMRPFVEHANGLRCHTCGTHSPLPTTCPSCNSPYLQFRGLGTAGVADALRAHFSDRLVVHVDEDAPSVPPSGAHIIVATERYTNSIAPTDRRSIGLVAVLHTERYVRGDDFRGAERLLSALRDIAVWARTWNAELLAQSNDPEHPALRTLQSGDLATWYRNECAERIALHYPPASRLLRCDAETPNADAAALIHLLTPQHRARVCSIDGPYAYGMRRKTPITSIIVRLDVSATDADIAAVVQSIPSAWSVDLDPRELHA